MMQPEPIPLERVKDLQEKVDALVRSLVGSGQQRDARLEKEAMETGLDHLLCADGFDAETGLHKATELSRKKVLDKFHNVFATLDDVARKGSQLFATYNQELVVPREMPPSISDVPDSLVCIMLPEIEEKCSSLLAESSKRRDPAMTDTRQAEMISESMRLHVESSESLIKDAIKSVKGGTGLRKQPRRIFEQGWHDPEAEKLVLGAILAEAKPKPIIQLCQDAGLRSIDFKDKDHERVWEAIEKIKTNSQVKDELINMGVLLKKELGEARKLQLQKLEAAGKKNLNIDATNLALSIVLRGRLRRTYDAVSKGYGLKADSAPAPEMSSAPHAAPPFAMNPASRMPMGRGMVSGPAPGAVGRGMPANPAQMGAMGRGAPPAGNYMGMPNR